MFSVSFSMSIKIRQVHYIKLNFVDHIKKLVLPFLMTERVPAPTNLQITDVTTESFRGTWDHAASDVSLYRVTWAPFGSSDKMEVVLTLFLFLFLVPHLMVGNLVLNRYYLCCQKSILSC